MAFFAVYWLSFCSLLAFFCSQCRKNCRQRQKNCRQRHNKSRHIKKIALSELQATIAHFCARRPFRWASRATTEHRNIQKKRARCQKNMGAVINHLRCTKQNQNRKGVGRQWNKRHTMRYIRNKGNEQLDMIDIQILTLALR
jgi:hypothetical protein